MNTAMAIEAMEVMVLPKNPVTDGFGPWRDWSAVGALDPATNRLGWYPGVGYRPIHYGVDFSARPDDAVYAPCDGLIGYRRDERMLIVIPTLNNRTIGHMAIYLMHVDSDVKQDPSEWQLVRRGEWLGRHQNDGRFAPHLHFELAVSMQLYADLVGLRMIDQSPFGVIEAKAKATARGLDTTAVWNEIENQKSTDGIVWIQHGAILRSRFPNYKRNPYSELGGSIVAVVDPIEALGHAS